MAGHSVYNGRIVGINSRAYSFPDRATGEIISGTSHTIFLRTDDDAEPIMELRANDEVSVVARSHDGKSVAVVAEPRARDSRVTWHALSINGG